MNHIRMTKQNYLIPLITVLIAICLGCSSPVEAVLPPGNAVKDPSAILRKALPVDQKDLQEIQNKLENTNDAIKNKRWKLLGQAATSSQFQLRAHKNQILNEIPNTRIKKGKELITRLEDNLIDLETQAEEQNQSQYINIRNQSLQEIGNLEALLLSDDFPFIIPERFNDLPRLLGRSTVAINTNKGTMKAIIDGYNAPLTAGAFIDLSLKGFYDDLPFIRAEDFYVLQAGDPIGDAIGYEDPNTGLERNVPLEIRVPEKEDPYYGQTLEDIGLYKSQPILPFATHGTLGWAHSNEDVNDGSSQFFIFLYDAELTPAGRNLIDGRNAAFGYIIDGFKVLDELVVDDKILSIKVIEGEEYLQDQA